MMVRHFLQEMSMVPRKRLERCHGCLRLLHRRDFLPTKNHQKENSEEEVIKFEMMG